VGFSEDHVLPPKATMDNERKYDHEGVVDGLSKA
jgi:hypothetical protein